MSNSFVSPWTVTHQALLSMEFSRQEYWGEKKRILEWVVMPSRGEGEEGRGELLPWRCKKPTRISCIGRRILYH